MKIQFFGHMDNKSAATTHIGQLRISASAEKLLACRCSEVLSLNSMSFKNKRSFYCSQAYLGFFILVREK